MFLLYLKNPCMLYCKYFPLGFYLALEVACVCVCVCVLAVKVFKSERETSVLAEEPLRG